MAHITDWGSTAFNKFIILMVSKWQRIIHALLCIVLSRVRSPSVFLAHEMGGALHMYETHPMVVLAGRHVCVMAIGISKVFCYNVHIITNRRTLLHYWAFCHVFCLGREACMCSSCLMPTPPAAAACCGLLSFRALALAGFMVSTCEDQNCTMCWPDFLP